MSLHLCKYTFLAHSISRDSDRNQGPSLLPENNISRSLGNQADAIATQIRKIKSVNWPLIAVHAAI